MTLTVLRFFDIQKWGWDISSAKKRIFAARRSRAVLCRYDEQVKMVGVEDLWVKRVVSASTVSIIQNKRMIWRWDSTYYGKARCGLWYWNFLKVKGATQIAPRDIPISYCKYLNWEMKEMLSVIVQNWTRTVSLLALFRMIDYWLFKALLTWSHS